MSFAHSLNKSHGFLMPYRRPTFGRTLSNSSEFSLGSNGSNPSEDMAGEAVASEPGTPVLTPMENQNTSFPQHDSESPTRPINIELPKSRKSGASVYTPTETLSARGDLPGGYFPMHEDPKCRIRRTHPFHSENRPKNTETTVDMQDQQESSSSSAAAWQSTHTPVSSYMPSGSLDHSLPLGKYYPSNYEKRTRQLQNQRCHVSESAMSYAKMEAQGTTYKGGDDARQRLQQYQRDMVAQASIVLGASCKANMLPGNAAAALIRNLPVPDFRLGVASAPQGPISPQLLPMGSPGPVTPMDLEAQEEYIHSAKVVAKENIAPPSSNLQSRSL